LSFPQKLESACKKATLMFAGVLLRVESFVELLKDGDDDYSGYS